MIELKNVSFQYNGSHHGVKSVNLTVKEGECVVLTGKSGCGKTTVTRLVNGLAPKYYTGMKSGSVYIGGKDIESMPSYDVGKVVGSIFQDPQRQFFSSELEGEIAFACENYGFSKQEIRKRTDDAIHKMGLENIGNVSLDLLSSGEKQRAAVASVYALYPCVFVFDEPTSNLDKEGIVHMKKILAELKAMGYTLLIAEHRISWIGNLADRYVYMQDGEIQKQYSASEFAAIGRDDRISKGLRCTSELSFREMPSPSHTRSIVMQTEKISLKKNKKQILKDVDIFVNERSITAITGGNGIGKTSLALILSGLQKPGEGNIYIRGKKTGHRMLRNRIYYCSNDTGTQFFTESVSEELLLGLERSAENLEKARELLKFMNLYDYKDSHPASLSGGQKQRLAVCCALLSLKDILILDEPTSGLDAENMFLIAKALKNAVKRGKTILVITHDDEFMAACCEYQLNMNKIPTKSKECES